MEFLDGQEAYELLQNYMTMAPKDIQEAWAVYDKTFNDLIAAVARKALADSKLTATSE